MADLKYFTHFINFGTPQVFRKSADEAKQENLEMQQRKIEALHAVAESDEESEGGEEASDDEEVSNKEEVYDM